MLSCFLDFEIKLHSRNVILKLQSAYNFYQIYKSAITEIYKFVCMVWSSMYGIWNINQ